MMSLGPAGNDFSALEANDVSFLIRGREKSLCMNVAGGNDKGPCTGGKYFPTE